MTAPDEQMIADIAKAIAAAIVLQDGHVWTPTDDWDYRFAYLDQGEVDFKRVAAAAHSVIAGRVAELTEALEAIDKTTFIGATTDSHETRQAALESAHDIARAALAPYPEGTK